jgi:predicted nucleic acid-binding protein
LNTPAICRDPDDDEVLGVADWGGVNAVVTGEQDLLALGEYAKARILPPREFLDCADEVGRDATSSE